MTKMPDAPRWWAQFIAVGTWKVEAVCVTLSLHICSQTYIAECMFAVQISGLHWQWATQATFRGCRCELLVVVWLINAAICPVKLSVKAAAAWPISHGSIGLTSSTTKRNQVRRMKYLYQTNLQYSPMKFMQKYLFRCRLQISTQVGAETVLWNPGRVRAHQLLTEVWFSLSSPMSPHLAVRHLYEGLSYP